MKTTSNHGRLRARCAWLIVIVLLSLSSRAQAKEEKFDLLRTKTTVYTNVTVTSQTKSDVYIFHAGGICNLKVADLSSEALQQLGYVKDADAADSGSIFSSEGSTASKAAAATKQLNTQLTASVQKMSAAAGTTVLLIAAAVSVLMYLFLCYCFGLICKKSGVEAGVLVWLPILQLLPLLKAARMSPAWIIAWLLPGLNLIAHIAWCFKITKARQKAAWAAILLLLPVTNLIALLYLAFSDGNSSKDEELHAGPLVLETN